MDRSKYKAHNLEVNDILVSIWGYEQTNACFYQVVSLNGVTQATIQKIESEDISLERTHTLTGKVLPKKNSFVSSPLKKKVKFDSHSGEWFVNITDYQWAEKWDGKEKSVTYWG